MATHFPTSGNDRLAAKLNALSDPELAQVLEFIEDLEASRRRSLPPLASDDDLIAALAGETENRRAQQVYAGESVRRRAQNDSPFPYIF